MHDVARVPRPAGRGRCGRPGRLVGQVAARAVRHPAVLPGAGVLVFSALALAAFAPRRMRYGSWIPGTPGPVAPGGGRLRAVLQPDYLPAA